MGEDHLSYSCALCERCDLRRGNVVRGHVAHEPCLSRPSRGVQHGDELRHHGCVHRFADEHVRILAGLLERFAVRRIAGEDDGAPVVADAVAESGHDGEMVDFEAFEIDPADEKDFNDIYDTEHIPNIMQVEGVRQVIRLKDAEPTPQGWLKYSALYLIDSPDLPSTPQWRAKSDIGRWAPVIRPKVKARRQRLGAVVANTA